MTETDDPAVRLVRRSGGARAATDASAPAVLVTAWLLAELADSPAVLIEQVGPDELHLRGAAGVEAALRAELARLLDDVRFAGWVIVTDADTTRTLLEPHTEGSG